MSVVGLITEYNPFHNGHLYHIQEARRTTNAEAVVVVMSGNFVQRGTVAIMDKYTRTKMAMEAGADLVIELPTCYATASAEYFAFGAVSLLEQLGFVDCLVFGSECGDIDLLKEIARLYEEEPPELSKLIQIQLKKGISYPSARANALLDYFEGSHHPLKRQDMSFEEILNSPNNILGIEYLRALIRLNSSICPYTITRIQNDFHSSKLTGSISSATAIRKSLTAQDFDLTKIKDCVPSFAYSMLKKAYQTTFPIEPNDISLLLKYKLLELDGINLEQYLDVSKDLANRITKSKISTHTFLELVDEIRSKQYTQTRIQRALLHILLGIKKEEMEQYVAFGHPPYARILGLRKSASSYLRHVKQTDDFTVITKLSRVNLEGVAKQMLDLDIYAAHLYNLIIAQRFHQDCKDEYTRGVILL